jgi:CBS domain containing-hemolysin-like protein
VSVARHPRARGRIRLALLAALACAPLTAQASFLAGETLDKAADVLAIAVLFIVPLAVIALFWMVHVLPEKIAEKRHHPQQTAIKTLCLLSLVFGGLLWPLAWLWAYTKPVGYRLAYGTDKHDNYFREAVEQAEKGDIAQAELDVIRHELDGLAARGQLTPELRAVHQQLVALQTALLKQEPGSQQQPAPHQQPGRPEGAA